MPVSKAGMEAFRSTGVQQARKINVIAKPRTRH
jgi:hypothetical protein